MEAAWSGPETAGGLGPGGHLPRPSSGNWLAYSRTSVWALGLSGQVYRRTGLSHTHWLGDSWQAVSGWDSDTRAVDLSVGQCDSVWSLDQAGIIDAPLMPEQTDQLLFSSRLVLTSQSVSQSLPLYLILLVLCYQLQWNRITFRTPLDFLTENRGGPPPRPPTPGLTTCSIIDPQLSRPYV